MARTDRKKVDCKHHRMDCHLTTVESVVGCLPDLIWQIYQLICRAALFYGLSLIFCVLKHLKCGGMLSMSLVLMSSANIHLIIYTSIFFLNQKLWGDWYVFDKHLHEINDFTILSFAFVSFPLPPITAISIFCTISNLNTHHISLQWSQPNWELRRGILKKRCYYEHIYCNANYYQLYCAKCNVCQLPLNYIPCLSTTHHCPIITFINNSKDSTETESSLRH